MFRRSAAKRIAEVDAKRVTALLDMDYSFMEDAQKFFYLFYFSTFIQAGQVALNDSRRGAPAKTEIYEATELKDILLDNMRLLVDLNKDYQLIVTTVLSDKVRFRAEVALLKGMLERMGWQGKPTAFFEGQSPDFIFAYSRLNAFLKCVIKDGVENQTLNKEDSNHVCKTH